MILEILQQQRIWHCLLLMTSCLLFLIQFVLWWIGSCLPCLNAAVTKNVSVELARKKDPIICILLHPGTVDTDLSQPFQRNVPKEKLFTKEFSVQKLLSIINNTKRSDNGKFFAWDGQEIPWWLSLEIQTWRPGIYLVSIDSSWMIFLLSSSWSVAYFLLTFLCMSLYKPVAGMK